MADFVIIYIEEAHANDQWRLENNTYNYIKQHQKMEERLAAAEELCKLDPHCPVYVDTMKNEAIARYGALPERLFIALDSVIVYEGKPGPHGYSPDEVQDWLKKHFRS